MEVSKQEVDEYYSPKDFQVGQRMKLLGRNFLLYDCDGFTKEYYQKNHPEMEMKSTEVPKKVDMLQDWKKVNWTVYLTYFCFLCWNNFNLNWSPSWNGITPDKTIINYIHLQIWRSLCQRYTRILHSDDTSYWLLQIVI